MIAKFQDTQYPNDYVEFIPIFDNNNVVSMVINTKTEGDEETAMTVKITDIEVKELAKFLNDLVKVKK